MPFSLKRKSKKNKDSNSSLNRTQSKSTTDSLRSFNQSALSHSRANSIKLTSPAIETPQIKSIRSRRNSNGNESKRKIPRIRVSHYGESADEDDDRASTITSNNLNVTNSRAQSISNLSSNTSNRISSAHHASTQSLENEMAAAPDLESTQQNGGIFSSIVNAAHHAASTLVSSQKLFQEASTDVQNPSGSGNATNAALNDAGRSITPRPAMPNATAHDDGTSNANTSSNFLQHLDSLLSRDATTSKKNSSSVTPEPEALNNNDDLNSIASSKKSIAGEVVFQPLRPKPISTLGQGELTLEDLGFAEGTPQFERNVSLKTNNNSVPPRPTSPTHGELHSSPDINIENSALADIRPGVVRSLTNGNITPDLTGGSVNGTPTQKAFPPHLSTTSGSSTRPRSSYFEKAKVEKESDNIIRLKSLDADLGFVPNGNSSYNSNNSHIHQHSRPHRSTSPSNSYLRRSMSPINNLLKSTTRSRPQIDYSNVSSPDLATVPGNGNSDALTLNGDTSNNNITVQRTFSQTKLDGINLPSQKRQNEFHNLFPTIPQDEKLLEDFSCALQRDILVQGKMYLSQRHISFNSNILGWTTNLTIPLKEVVQIEKKTIAGLFPNSIAVRSLHQRYLFASLIQRDSTFAVILGVWRQVVRSERGEDAADDGAGVGGPGDGASSVVDQGSGFSDYSDDEDEDDDEFDDYSRSSRNADASTFDEGGYDDEDDSAIYDVNSPDDDRPLPKTSASSTSDVLGPSKHKPTEYEHESVSGETKILERTIDAPMGKIANLLFGNDVSFLKSSIEKQKNHSISDIPTFAKFEESETRSYTYVKPLNSPVGPKETLCQVEEIIQHYDFNQYVAVQQRVKSPDVPSGGSFVVNTYIYLSWDVKNSTKVTIFTAVEWTGKSWIKAAVEKGTVYGQKDSLNKLIDDVIVAISSSNTSSSSGAAASTAASTQEEIVSNLPILGPKTHGPTSAPIKPKSSETQVLDDIIPAPLGTTFQLLFQDDDTSLFSSILAKQKNYKISTIPGFSNKKRSYEYTKPINAPIGPKETKCLVSESIENMDFNQYCLVVQTTQTPDVPSGNNFSTVTSIYLSWAENNQTKITVLTEVQWRGRSWIKGPVEKGAVDGQKESMAILSAELKDYIAKNSGSKKSKKGVPKRGRSSTKATIQRPEKPAKDESAGIDRSGILGPIMTILDPLFSLVGIDTSKWTLSFLFSCFILTWFTASFIWNTLLGKSRSGNGAIGYGKNGQGFELNELNKVIINGEEFLMLPTIPNLLQNSKSRESAEYDIWEWIESRRDEGVGGKKKQVKEQQVEPKFAKDHKTQDLKYMIDLAQLHLDTLKKSVG